MVGIAGMVKTYVHLVALRRLTMKELIKEIDHHYSSDATARGSIVQWTRAGKIKGVTLDESMWPMRIYPEGYEIPGAD